jgi:uncharacterized protein
VKADDVGLALARYDRASVSAGAIRLLGRALVRGMPAFLAVLSTIGTAAMIWVGGGIILHGIEQYGPPVVGQTVHAATEAAAHLLPSIAGIVEWSVEAAISGVIGLLVGAVAIPAVTYGLSPLWKHLKRSQPT